jgi:hypothetical protein
MLFIKFVSDKYADFEGMDPPVVPTDWKVSTIGTLSHATGTYQLLRCDPPSISDRGPRNEQTDRHLLVEPRLAPTIPCRTEAFQRELTMTRLLLSIVGAMYLGLGIWCAVQPQKTSRTVGLQIVPGAGQSEFLTIYGGLEVGLGLAFLAPWVWNSFERSSLLFCLLVHAGIVVFRTIGFFAFSGIPKTTIVFAAVEWVILLLCCWRMRV